MLSLYWAFGELRLCLAVPDLLLAALDLDIALFDDTVSDEALHEVGNLGAAHIERLSEHHTTLEVVGEHRDNRLDELGVELSSRQLLGGGLAVGVPTLLVLSVVGGKPLLNGFDDFSTVVLWILTVQDVEDINIGLANSHSYFLSAALPLKRWSLP